VCCNRWRESGVLGRVGALAAQVRRIVVVEAGGTTDDLVCDMIDALTVIQRGPGEAA
jgi:predicted site-specific integrase-resolvase